MMSAARVVTVFMFAFLARAPWCGGAEEGSGFTFAVIGDHRNGLTVYEGIIRKVLEIDPALVIHTGDLVLNGADAAEWKAFTVASKPLVEHSPAPGLAGYLYPTIGNHELWPDGNRAHLAHYFEAFKTVPANALYYSFDYGNSHFISLFFPEESDIVLNSAELSAMLAWLESDLQAASLNPVTKWKFVFFHASMFSSTSRHGCSPMLHQSLIPILNTHKVDAVFNGHTHAYQRYGPLKYYDEDPEGVTYIVSAGCGSELYPLDRLDDANYPGCDAATGTHHVVRAAHVESSFHYVMIDVTDDRVSGVMHREDGTVMDTFIVRGKLGFARGDINVDGRRNIADVVCLLGNFFNAQDEMYRALVARCPDAADANDDGNLNISDAIRILGYLFALTGPLPAPFDACGVDPTSDDLDCRNFPPCEGL